MMTQKDVHEIVYDAFHPRNDISETKKNPVWKTRFIFSSGNGWRPSSGTGCCMYRLAMQF